MEKSDGTCHMLQPSSASAEACRIGGIQIGPSMKTVSPQSRAYAPGAFSKVGAFASTVIHNFHMEPHHEIGETDEHQDTVKSLLLVRAAAKKLCHYGAT